MDEQEARKVLEGSIRADNSLYNLGHYMSWSGESTVLGDIVLDDHFTIEELEAIVWWTRNMKVIR